MARLTFRHIGLNDTLSRIQKQHLGKCDQEETMD